MTTRPVELLSRPRAVPADSAAAALLALDLGGVRPLADAATDADVTRALSRGRGRDIADFAALLSPAASARLEEIAVAARDTTLQRFGRARTLFAPLYVSNECVSVCTYCGFSAGNDVARRTLSIEEVRAETRELAARGFRHVLLVAGEHARIISKDYLVDCVGAAAETMASVAVEVQVWDEPTYVRLVNAGADGVVVYQEAYDRDTYASVHLLGKKRNYEWRLAAPDRAAAAGARKLGIGALLGLHPDWRSEALAVAAHARQLMHRWWRCEVSVAVPRLRPAAGGYETADPVDDRAFTQLICALRLFLPDAGITLSTREPAALRDALVALGVTTLSAGSHTEPGGYAAESDAEPQFEISDTRTPAEVATALRANGYDPVWKDWTRV
ncbi:MAG TPA: 2-iminoacetate synthase ThiH [Acidimicrobiales bacterium]|nr:2-iminoacetate synthase ThiH [Acidimicrobiales bacterium]